MVIKDQRQHDISPHEQAGQSAQHKSVFRNAQTRQAVPRRKGSFSQPRQLFGFGLTLLTIRASRLLLFVWLGCRTQPGNDTSPRGRINHRHEQFH
jgi:hypothetical protein